MNIDQLKEIIKQITDAVELLQSTPISLIAPQRSDVVLKLRDAIEDLEAIVTLMHSDGLSAIEACHWCDNELARDEFRCDGAAFCSQACRTEWQEFHQ